MDRKIKVLIVEDSSFVRGALRAMISAHSQFEVVGVARDGQEAVEKIALIRPDVVTMDLEMPRMDGLTAIRIIMREHPLPILVVSSLSKEGARITFDALEAGAADYIHKLMDEETMSMQGIQAELIAKLDAIAHAGPPRPVKRLAHPISWEKKAHRTAGSVLGVVIGASTGGPKALTEILPELPKEFPVGVVVVQHMPPPFTASFAERLGDICKLPVQEARDGEPLNPGTINIAPGGVHLTFRRVGLDVRFHLSHEPRESVYKPSINECMSSAAMVLGSRLVGVILTGMGSDGMLGMQKIKREGGKTLVQDKETSTIYGMPKAVIEQGLADKIVPMERIAFELVNMV